VFDACTEEPGPAPTTAGCAMSVPHGLAALDTADTALIPGWWTAARHVVVPPHREGGRAQHAPPSRLPRTRSTAARPGREGRPAEGTDLPVEAVAARVGQSVPDRLVRRGRAARYVI
jgi:hypothetical protein